MQLLERCPQPLESARLLMNAGLDISILDDFDTGTLYYICTFSLIIIRWPYIYIAQVVALFFRCLLRGFGRTIKTCASKWNKRRREPSGG